MKTWIKPIAELGACHEALEWAEEYDSLDDAWAQCERGDRMLWLAGRLSGKLESPKRIPFVLATCGCARLALPFVPVGEEKSRNVIETVEAWARGEATIVQVRDALYAFAYATHSAYAAYAADVASNAATHSANVADSAYAANAASYATHSAAYGERLKILKQCADIVRQYYPKPPEVE